MRHTRTDTHADRLTKEQEPPFDPDDVVSTTETRRKRQEKEGNASNAVRVFNCYLSRLTGHLHP